MAAIKPNPFAAVTTPLTHLQLNSSIKPFKSNLLTCRFALSTVQSLNSTPAASRPSPVPGRTTGSRVKEAVKNDFEGDAESDRLGSVVDEEVDNELRRRSVIDYFEQGADLVKSTGDGGGPRWFTPVECGPPRLNRAPLLLYLPGVDGIGLGLVRHQRKLARLFEVWCLHIPVMDQTQFTELVKLVEGTVQSEYSQSPGRPIYLVGESLGACLALAVASRNPNIDLVLVLANPATSFSKSPLQLFGMPQMKLLSSMLESIRIPISPLDLNPLKGDYVTLLVDAVEQGLGRSKAAKDLLQGLRSLTSYYSGFTGDDILPIHTFLWKMEMLKNGCAYANSCLHAVKAQTLVLTSGRDTLLPSQDEGERLRRLIPKCEIRKFSDNGHFLFLEDGVDLVYTVKVASFYRRGKCHDYVSDYLPPTSSEFKRFQDRYGWVDLATSPVMLSTLEDGKIVRGLAGIPSEGPTLLVGYHMLMGFELSPMVGRFFTEKNIVLRGIAHPMMFYRSKVGKLPDLSEYDLFRLLGAVPVSATNMFKLLASKSHVLLYPGGMREALHRKGEEYQLFWPEQADFVRMAARFGAKIVPFGTVGEDDIGQLVVDYDDLVKIPYFKAEFEALSKEAVRLRTDSKGEVANQPAHLPGILPKVPGRLYYLFGKPIDTNGRRQELRDKQKAHDLYIEIKSEVEKCLAYLMEKREHDPYRSILPRLLHMSTHGIASEIPTFEH